MISTVEWASGESLPYLTAWATTFRLAHFINVAFLHKMVVETSDGPGAVLGALGDTEKLQVQSGDRHVTNTTSG